jgi:hypothetical protein
MGTSASQHFTVHSTLCFLFLAELLKLRKVRNLMRKREYAGLSTMIWIMKISAYFPEGGDLHLKSGFLLQCSLMASDFMR